MKNYGNLSASDAAPDQDEKKYAINVVKVIDLYRGKNWIFERFGRVYLDVMEYIELLLPRGTDNEEK